MEWHPRFGILGSDSFDQLGIVGIAGNDGGPARLSLAQRFFAKGEGDACLLADSSVAGTAILIQNGADVAAEVNWIAGPQRKKT